MALADFRGGAVLVDYLDFGRGLSLSRQTVGGAQVLQIGGGTLDVDLQAAAGDELVINEAGVDADFRVEGDTDANLLFIDASTDRVGIGTSTPGVLLQVAGACTIDSALIVTAGGITLSDGVASLTDNTGATTAPLLITNATLTQTSFHGLSIVGADAALGADNDEVYMTFLMRDEEAGPTAAAEIARISAVYINAEAADDGSLLTFDVFLANSLTEVMRVGQNAAADATSQLLVLQGTTLLPNYSEIGDPNTGMNLDGSDGIELVTGGAAELTLTTTGGTFAGTCAVTGRLTASQALTPGDGVSEATVNDSGVFVQGTIIVTRIMVDLAALVVDDADLDIIGEDDANNCHWGQITAALSGTIVGGTMTCLEVPAGAGTVDDIDLYSATVSTGQEGVASGVASLVETVLLTAGGAWTAGLTRVLTGFPPDNDYLYLVAGAAGGDSTAFTAGKFLIELYGT